MGKVRLLWDWLLDQVLLPVLQLLGKGGDGAPAQEEAPGQESKD